MKIQQHAFIESATINKVVAKADFKVSTYPLKDIKENATAIQDIQKQRIAAVKAMPIDHPISIQPLHAYGESCTFGKDLVAYDYVERFVDGDGKSVFYTKPEDVDSHSISINVGTLKESHLESVVKEVEQFARKHNIEFHQEAVTREVRNRLRDNVGRLIYEQNYGSSLPSDLPF